MRYVVSARGGAEAAVDAPNWLAALGVGLDELGNVGAIDRLACEVLMNGTVLARDARTGQGYVVRPLDAPAPAPASDDEGSELALGDDGELFGTDPDDEGADEAELEATLAAEPVSHAEPPLRLGAPVHEVDSAEMGELPSSSVRPLPPRPVPLDLPEPDSATIDPVGVLGTVDEDGDSEVIFDDDITDRFLRSDLPRFVLEGLADIRDAVAVGPACEQTLARVRSLVPAESGSILVLEPDDRMRFLHVVGPNEDQLTGSVLPPGKGIAAFCLRRATGLIVRRASTDPHFYGEVDRVTGYTTHSVLCVPIVAGGHRLGCVQLINPPSDRRFETDDLRVVQDVAEALGQRLLEERLG